MNVECEQNLSIGEVLSETCQGFRNAVLRGDLSPEKALEMSERARWELSIISVALEGAARFETDSTQIKSLIEEGRRLKSKIEPPLKKAA